MSEDAAIQLPLEKHVEEQHEGNDSIAEERARRFKEEAELMQRVSFLRQSLAHAADDVPRAGSRPLDHDAV